VLEATWHPTQTVEAGADGSLVWRATVSGTIEVRLWILSWGDDVEVLAPESLREDVAATHRRALERYTTSAGVAAGSGAR
jgi:proteasome accessory factor B